MFGVVILASKILLTIFFIFSVQGQTGKTLETQQLDDLMLKTCRGLSPSSTCQTRMAEIRQGIDPAQLVSTAPKLDIDSKIQTNVINSVTKMIADYYCLARFNHLISSKDIEPDVFSYAVRGLSFSKESEKQYAKWLSSSASIDCRKELSQIGLQPSLIKLDRPYQVVLNPITFFEAGAEEDFYGIADTTYNHERLHAVFSMEKAKAKTIKLWNGLSKGQQAQFQLEHPSYNFRDKKVLAREFFSYTFEKEPSKAYDFLKGKHDKSSYEDLQKQLCTFCTHQDLKTVDTSKALAKLDAKDLLARIEKEGIKVLILTSGRKNPSPLFNWGNVRIDKGQLNQITKLEGAMGKTLCRGEKSESAEGVTVVLAADSPYSTLIHEYLHVLQIRRDGSWCPVSKQLWGKENVSPWEQRMIRDREWDVRLTLWDLFETPHMNVEDRLILVDGLLNEAALRKSFDPSVDDFINKNGLKVKRDKEIKAYMETLKLKK